MQWPWCAYNQLISGKVHINNNNNKYDPRRLYSDGNERWPRRVLPPGKSCWVCAAHPVKVRKRDRQTDRQRDRQMDAVSEIGNETSESWTFPTSEQWNGKNTEVNTALSRLVDGVFHLQAGCLQTGKYLLKRRTYSGRSSRKATQNVCDVATMIQHKMNCTSRPIHANWKKVHFSTRSSRCLPSCRQPA